MLVFEKDKYVTISHKKEMNYLLFDWINMSISITELKNAHDAAYQWVIQKGVKTLVADTSKAKSFLFPECIEWWANVQVPIYAQAGVKSIITVIAHSMKTKSTNAHWQGGTDSIKIYEVNNLIEAEKLIQNMSSTT